MSSTPVTQEEMSNVPEEQPLLGYNVGFGRGGKRKLPPCCMPCCLVYMIFTVIICGALAIGLGVAYNAINDEVKKVVAQKVALTPDGESIDKFASSPVPVHMTFYLFNLTNADEFLNHGSKPIVKEIGPFVYIENKTKFDMVWNEDESILRYNESCIYTFNESETKLHPHKTNITTLNLPLLGLLVQFEKLQKMVENLPEMAKELVDDIIKGLDNALKKEFSENLFITRSVDEIIWGYEDPFLKYLSQFDLSFLPIPKDGIFRLENRTGFTGPNMVYTGKYNSRDTARYLMWNGQFSISGWGTPYAAMLNGTEALLFHPGVKRGEHLEVFVSELFRSGYFSYYQDVTEYGIEMHQFRLPPEELKKENQDPGFFMDAPDGVLNLTAVYPLNVPVVVSKPHFLDADKIFQTYLNDSSEINPDRNKHDAFLNVEPVTGATLHAAKRLQINIRLAKTSHLTEFAKLPNITYLPILWVEEGGQLDSSSANDLKNQVYMPMKIVKGGTIGVIAVGGFISVILFLLLFIYGTYKCEQKIRNKRQNGRIQYDD